MDATEHQCPSKSTDDDNVPLFGPFCPDREFMLTLLREDIEQFKLYAPVFTLHMDKDSDGDTFLHRLVYKFSKEGYTEQIKNTLDLILKEALELTYEKNNTGATPLMLACERADCPELILQLAEASPKTSQLQNINRDIPLLKFVTNVKVDHKTSEMKIQKCCLVVETLLKHGENVNHENRGKKSSLCYLLERNDLPSDIVIEIAKLLFKNGAKLVCESSIHVFQYVKKLSLKLIEIITEICPLELLNTDFNVWTALQHMLEVRRHCDDDSDCSYCNNQYSNFTSPWVSVPCITKFESDDELLEALKIIFKCFKQLPEDIMGSLIYLSESEKWDFKIVLFLINKLSSPFTMSSTNTLLVNYATSLENVSKLLSYGADPNAVLTVRTSFSKEKKIALSTAATARSKEAIIKLLEVGADPLMIVRMDDHWIHFDKFIPFIAEDGCLDLLKYILDLPLMKDTQTSKDVSKFYNLLIKATFEQFDKENVTQDKLELIVAKIKSQNVNMICECREFGDDLKYSTEPFGSLFNHIGGMQVETKLLLLPNLYIFVNKMLDAGFTVSKLPDNVITPLTVLLNNLRTSNMNSILMPLIDLIVEKGGVNVESTVLTSSGFFERQNKTIMESSLVELSIPDVLATAIKYLNPEIIEKFLPYWWGPPIALTSVLNYFYITHRVNDERMMYFDNNLGEMFLKYGEPPYGSTLLSTSVWGEMHFWYLTINIPGAIPGVHPPTPTIVSPASLQELCKYAVRHSVAETARHSDTSLPKLLHQVLPPLLRRAVIH